VTLPLTTTTITIERAGAHEPYETPTWTTVATGVPAHISSPNDTERVVGGDREVIDAKLLADTTDLVHIDRVTDAATGEVFSVLWAQRRIGFDLAHIEAGLKRVS
jgi:hypothetical protein